MTCLGSHSEFEVEPGLEPTSDFLSNLYVLGSGLWTPSRRLNNWCRTD